jgi:hypothetical protein
MKPDICIFHANCADGFGAAWAVWKRWGDEVEFVPGVYGKEPPDVAGKNVLLVDFSYKRPVLEAIGREMTVRGGTITILDHHKTAQADLEPFIGNGLFGISDLRELSDFCAFSGVLPIRATFDMEKSGAVLTWEFLHAEPVPQLLLYVQDRDLWRFQLPLSREIAAYVFSLPYDFRRWSDMAAMAEDAMLLLNMADQGGAIERKHSKDIGELLAQTRRSMRIGGYDVPVANLPYTMSSDAAGMLAEGQPFGACYFDRNDGQRIFSLRSRGDTGIDVSEIAKGYGGGGHRNAAGFQAPLGWEGDPTA